MSGVARPPAHRVHPGSAYALIKTASHDLLEATGSAEAAARGTRGSGETLRKAAHHEHDSFLAADQIADIEKRTGRPLVTAALAEVNGYLLIPTPASLEGAGVEHRSMKECSEAVASIAEALANGGLINRDETPKVRREVREAILALFTLDQQLEDTYPDVRPARARGA
ncbi:phage regulatory CII family protein [Maricaulis maris]|uniref:phage regulatory CII family protein n=1 Tax=Maricaulis maris TaxID=74318 RepID=UPI003B8B0567